MSGKRRTAALDFYRRWRSFQEQYRVVAQSYSSTVSLLELSILIELEIDPARSQRDFVRLFRVTPQVLSRAVQRLLKRSFIRESRGQADGRTRALTLTAHGARQLASIDSEANAILEEMIRDLPQRDVRRLREILGVLEQSFPDVRASVRGIDHPLRGPIRTFTRGFGLLGNSVFGVTEISTFEWHILAAVADGNGVARASDLAGRFHAPKNSLSVVLSRLERRRLIERSAAQGADSRTKPLALRPPGRQLLRRIETNAVRILAKAMEPLSDSALGELQSLMARFIQRDPDEYRVEVPFTVRPVRDHLGKCTGAAVFLGERCVGTAPGDRSDPWRTLDVQQLLKRALNPAP